MTQGSGLALFMELPEGWNDIINDEFRLGKSMVEAHLALQISAIEHKLLMSVEEYKNAMLNGMAYSEAYWMDWARLNVMDNKVNTKIFEIMTKRLFGWDKKLDKNDEDDAKIKDSIKKDADKFAQKYLKAVK
jgi:hypothetical protein